MVGRGVDEHSEVTRRAVLVYAVYMATNMGRARGGINPAEAAQAMAQFAKDAVNGHARAAKAVDNSWAYYDNTRAPL